MKYDKLSSACIYASDKIPTRLLNSTTYLSTENMLPNKNGITRATTLPDAKHVQAFRTADILISNIRPYFKKIWYATFDGGCSNDVLVVRANSKVEPQFLYYVLSSDAFFEYVMASSKGTKMPRGDKQAIMDYPIPYLLKTEQLKVVTILKAIDDKIAMNKQINRNLVA